MGIFIKPYHEAGGAADCSPVFSQGRLLKGRDRFEHPYHGRNESVLFKVWHSPYISFVVLNVVEILKSCAGEL